MFFGLTSIYFYPFIIAIICLAIAVYVSTKFLIVVLWIFIASIIIVGIASGIMHYFFLRYHFKKNPNVHSFIYSLGITAGYASFFYINLGYILKQLISLIIAKEEEEKYYSSHGSIYEDDIPFKITLYNYPFACYFIDLILYSGHFFNIFVETLVLKYDLSKFFIILLIIFQSVLYPLHMAYVIYYSIALIIVTIILPIIEILFGIMLYRKYEKDKKENTLISEEKDKNNVSLIAIS